jgi:hypothetical protein
VLTIAHVRDLAGAGGHRVPGPGLSARQLQDNQPHGAVDNGGDRVVVRAGAMLWAYCKGNRNFLWLGWATMLNGLLRMGGAAIAVLVLGWQAAGAMAGVLAGFIVAAGSPSGKSATCFAAHKCRLHGARGSNAPFPSLWALGAITYMLTQDGLAVQRFFSRGNSGLYAKAGSSARPSSFSPRH